MLAYCTYCSAEKNHSEKPLPAIELYKSERIAEVFSSAKTEGSRFVILSGKYGIVDPQQEIEDYDHLLKPSEVETHSELVATQLKEKNVSRIVFFMRSTSEDKNLKPYVDCIIAAGVKSGIPLEIREASFVD